MTHDLSPGSVEEHERWMTQALAQANIAAEAGEVPVGAVLVAADELLAAAHNAPISCHDATAHAEIQVLRQASHFRANYRLPGTTLYVTIEPCTMCVGALIHARIERLVFGAREPRAGAVASSQKLLEEGRYNHQIEVVEGILADSCGQIMQAFFQSRRAEVGKKVEQKSKRSRTEVGKKLKRSRTEIGKN